MSAIWDTYKYGKENPFYNDPMQKAYYHPSLPRKVDGKARQTSVSPSHKHQHLTAEEESRDYFPDRSNSYLVSRVGELGLGPDGDSVSFDESWPQSERPSTISISEVENLTPPSAAPLKRSSANVEKNQRVGSRLDTGEEERRKKQQRSTSEGRGRESTLSKYIERFRNSQPMSREQRLQVKATDPEDFWWLRSPSSWMMSPITDAVHSPIHNRSVLQGKDEDSLLHDDEQLNKKTKLLQENTNNFLEKMSSIGSSHPAVSTVGLGSDTGSLTTFEEEPYRPAFVRSREPIQRIMPQPRRPEDDILYRWRVQRKRELAKDQVTKFRTEPPYNNFSNQMTWMQTTASHNSQQTGKEKDREIKRDAVIQTSGVLDEPLVSYIPIACPHVMPSGNISVVTPHCHMSCDILTQAANGSCRDSRYNATTSLGDGDGPKQVVAHKAQGISGNSKMEDGKKTVSCAINLDRDLSDENVPEKEARWLCMHAAHDLDLAKERVKQKQFTLRKHPQKNRKSLQPLKNTVVDGLNTVVDGHDFNDTDIWQTTDNECQVHRCSSEADADRRQKKRFIGTEASNRAQDDGNSKSVNANSVALENEDKRHGMQQKAKSDKERRRRRLCTPKSQSSPIAIRSTIRQVINDRLLAASGSLVSSLDNFELSSLDLTVTELEEPGHDSSVPAASLGGSSPPVDLESVIYCDGEEFADDDILCNLRQRRLFCLQRLQELDQLILKSKTV